MLKTPKKTEDSPIGESEKITYQIISKKRNLRSRSKSDKKRRGGSLFILFRFEKRSRKN